MLKDLDSLVTGADALPRAAINEQTEKGKLALTSAREILRSLGKPDAVTIDVAYVADTTAIFA